MLYSVVLPASARSLMFNGVQGYLVDADSAAHALALVKAQSSEDIDGLWDNAVTTALNDLEGCTFDISIDTAVPTAVSYTAVAGDTFDEVGTALAAALVAAGLTSTWTKANTNLHGALQIAAGADGIGDKNVTTQVTGADGSTVVTNTFISDVVDGGLAADPLSCVLCQGSSYQVLGAYKGE